MRSDVKSESGARRSRPQDPPGSLTGRQRLVRGAGLWEGAALPASCSGSDSDASSSPSSSSELQLLGSLSPSSALWDLEVSSSYSSFSLLNQTGQSECRSETTHHFLSAQSGARRASP